LRLKYKIPENKICITVGYSSSPVQQHLQFIEKIKKFKTEVASKVILLFPLTYGIEKESEYYKTLIAEIESSGFDYLLFENRLSDEELCETRILSDIMVNIQTTDSQASSIKEAFAARNVVLVGDWLPYDFYSDEGVTIYKTNLNSLAVKLLAVLNNLPEYKKASSENHIKVTSFASWNQIIPMFINNYLEVVNGGNQ
jgi:glycosyltransferase involved in cell wall biosynthesis